MKMRTAFMVVLGILFFVLKSNITNAEKTFRQTEFVIGFWVDPPMDAKADERYREIAEANFTLAVGGFGARSPEQVRRQIELCKKYGLKALVWDGERSNGPLPADDVCLGYMLQDEPNTRDFARLRGEVAKIRQSNPCKLAFINLLPNYASPDQLGAKDYQDYLTRFFRTVHPQLLSTDHYPYFHPGTSDPRPGYRKNLAIFQENAAKAKIPFWMFFNSMPWGSHTDPTEAQLRWQIYSAVTYGARGVLYFCYYTPSSAEFPKGGAIIDRNDRKTRHYEQAKRINRELKNLGPVLMTLTSRKTLHLEGKKAFEKSDLAGTPLSLIKIAQEGDSPLDLEIGVFKRDDGREAVMVMNNDITYSVWPTIEFKTGFKKVVEIDKASGKEVPLYDESPNIPGLQISFDAGEGRLFLVDR